MGLTIHYKLALPRPVSSERVYFIVHRVYRQMEQFVARSGLAGISQIIPAIKEPFAVLYRRAGPRFPDQWVQVKPQAGWCFTVDVGEGCEPAMFGLCHYQQQMRLGEAVLPTRCGYGWRLEGFSKTQYASLHGEAHFLKCHRAVIKLAHFWKKFGIKVKIYDEGGYWPNYNKRKLLAEVGQMNRIVAGAAGAMKDLADEQGGTPVESPIFRHSRFEVLETEGLARHAGHIGKAVKLIAALKK